MPVLEEISIESVSPEITNTVPEEHIEEVISVELPHIEECPETNMEVEEMNKELSITTLEQEWNKDSIIHSEISDETATFPEESPENGLSISITGDAKTNIESTPILKEKRKCRDQYDSSYKNG